MELRRRGDWPLLEIQAARFVDNVDTGVARIARAALIEALMRSDQAEKRSEAALRAADLIREPDASPSEYLLAAASSEVVGDDAGAVDLAMRALGRWSGNSDIRAYAKALALRTGDTQLRGAADQAIGELQTP